jgi:hypothetical protein
MSEKLTEQIMRDILFKKPKTEKEKIRQIQAFNYVNKINKSREEHTGIPAVDRVIEKIALKYCEQCGEDMPLEHICLTCCGDEITGWVEDYMRCPTCKENI